MRFRFGIVVIAAATQVGCPNFPEGLCAQGDCGDGDGGTFIIRPSIEPGNVAAGTAECENLVSSGASPHDAPCTVDDQFGVFVAPTGNDESPGTKALPFRTVSRALGAIVSVPGDGGVSKRRIYVCAGTYNESIVIDSAHAPAGIYGGFNCPSGAMNPIVPAVSDAGLTAMAEATSSKIPWTWSAGARARIGPTGSQVDLPIPCSIHGLTTSIAIEDVQFDAPPAAGQESSRSGRSSVAALIEGSHGVAFRRVVFRASNATNGLVPEPRGNAPEKAVLAGNSSNDSQGGAGKACVCPLSGRSQGGQGGLGAEHAESGLPGSSEPIVPQTANAFNDGSGGAGGVLNASSCAVGHPGADGLSAVKQGASPTGFGGWTATGWVPEAGGRGDDGSPGQGGGGGGGAADPIVGGGGGGCGGCGGAGAEGGGGGGSSIAVLMIESSGRFDGCTFFAKDGANGASGGPASAGQPGGVAGMSSGGCSGGRGGAGGAGGAGGGGAGGLSLGIGYTGNAPVIEGAPVVDATKLRSVSLGYPGRGGAVGASRECLQNASATCDSGPARDGVSRAVFALTRK